MRNRRSASADFRDALTRVNRYHHAMTFRYSALRLRHLRDFLSEVAATRVTPQEAEAMARVYFRVVLAACISSAVIISPFLAGNPRGTLVAASLFGSFALLGLHFVNTGRPGTALHFFGPLVVSLAVVAYVFLGNNISMAAVIVFGFVPVLGAILGVVWVAAYLLAFVVACLAFVLLVSYGIEFPIVFPLPPRAQLGMVLFCSVTVALPLSALLTSIRTQRARADAELQQRMQHEAELVRAKERVEAANRAKDQFLDALSHELRTPMNGILGITSLLADETLSADQMALVGTLQTSANELQSLLKRLIEYAHLISGKTRLRPSPWSVSELVERAQHRFGTRALSGGVRLETTLADDVPPFVNADGARIEQAVLELLDNAFKFGVPTPPRTTDVVRLNISAQGLEADRVELVIEVADTGRGIAAADQARVFESFTQADGSHTRAVGGAGLGLALAQRWVMLMNGRITLTSAPDQGCRVTMSIPVDVLTLPE